VTAVTPPLLVLAWGNRSRGDDALGPLFAERLRGRLREPERGRVAFLEDFQLQVEHALDLLGRERVLFVDASLDCAQPFQASPVLAMRDSSFTTHAMSPAAVLQVFRELYGHEPPPCTLLAIRAARFELGAAPAAAALENLSLAVNWALGWLTAPADSRPAGGC